jgi:two-component system, NarL family, response regulator NreC
MEEPALPGSEITIVIADDHPVLRAGLRMLLEAEEDFEVVDEAGDIPTTLRKVLAYRPRVLVLDLHMPGEPSLPAIPRIRETSPETGIVVLTMENDVDSARTALRSGALGYVLKESTDDELVQAIKFVAAGRTYLGPELGARLAAEPAEPAGPPDGLSPREVDVLKLIAVGHTNNEIASKLFLSVRTVESHRAQVQAKTQCSSRAELVAYAHEHDLLD